MGLPSQENLTRILAALRHGDQAARVELLSSVYDELKSLAQAKMRSERADHTLQPTALVHEVFIRLLGKEPQNWQNRAHFFGAAAEAMRRILVDYARSNRAVKRGGGKRALPLEEIGPSSERPDEILAVDEALAKLSRTDPQKSEVVKLRFFGGLTVEESAAVLGVSPRTVKRDWSFAKAWLHREVHTK